jgi:hypothetical protein
MMLLSGFYHKSHPQDVISMTIGKKASKILFEAEEVWSYTLNPMSKPDADKMLIASFVVEERTGKVDKSHFQALQKLLKNDTNFIVEELDNRIPFTPEVAFEFSKEGKIVVVLLDFDAEEVGISFGKQLYRFEFLNCRADFLKIVKEVFKESEAVQKLN